MTNMQQEATVATLVVNNLGEVVLVSLPSRQVGCRDWCLEYGGILSVLVHLLAAVDPSNSKSLNEIPIQTVEGIDVKARRDPLQPGRRLRPQEHLQARLPQPRGLVGLQILYVGADGPVHSHTYSDNRIGDRPRKL